MKKLILFYLLFLTYHVNAQSYWVPPTQKIKLKITVKKPYQPIDYSKLSSDFSNGLNEIARKREALRRYYDQITTQTIHSMNFFSVSINHPSILHEKIKITKVSVEEVQSYNRMLKNGFLEPNNYEFQINNVYNNFVNGIQQLVYINDLLNYFKEEKIFDSIISSIGRYNYKDNKLHLKLNNTVYKGSTELSIDELYNYFYNAINGGFSKFKSDFIKRKESEKENQRNLSKIREDFLALKNSIANIREIYLGHLSDRKKRSFYKKESEFIRKFIEFSLSKKLDKSAYFSSISGRDKNKLKIYLEKFLLPVFSLDVAVYNSVTKFNEIDPNDFVLPIYIYEDVTFEVKNPYLCKKNEKIKIYFKYNDDFSIASCNGHLGFILNRFVK